MCFSKETSLVTWFVVTLASISLYQKRTNNSKWMAIFIIVFSTVQLLEGILWYSIENNHKTLNKYITQCLLMVLWMEPISLTIGGILYSRGYDLKPLYILLLLLIGVLCYSVSRIIDDGHNFETTVGENGHLVWDKNGKFIEGDSVYGKYIFCLYLLGMMFAFLYMKPSKVAIPLFLTGFITYHMNDLRYKTGEFSSMWCFTATILVFISHCIL